MLGLSTKKYQAIAKLDPSAIRRGKDEQQLALTYRDGPLASADSDRTTTLQAGDRAPNAVLRGADGRSVQLHDVFRGPHFTALAYGPQAVECLRRIRWPAAGAKLTRASVGANGETADVALTDPTHCFRDIYGLSGSAIILVRPDGYIAQVATRDMQAKIQSAVLAMAPPLPA